MDEWDEATIPSALEPDRKFQIGLHPHYFKDIERVSDAKDYLEQYPQIKLILDTAHLYLAGEDFLEVFKEYRARVVAIHIKDWTEQYDRSPFEFSRGFSTLGQGELTQQLVKIVKYLILTDYPGWLIVEQDTPQGGTPLECASRSREWLRQQGI